MDSSTRGGVTREGATQAQQLLLRPEQIRAAGEENRDNAIRVLIAVLFALSSAVTLVAWFASVWLGIRVYTRGVDQLQTAQTGSDGSNLTTDEEAESR